MLVNLESLITDSIANETVSVIDMESVDMELTEIQNSLVLHKIRVYLNKLSTVISHVLNAVSKYLSFMSGVNALYSRLDVIFANAA